MRPELVFRRHDVRERVLALTFDDGPGDVTPAILDLLREYGARATFFVVAASLAGRENVARRAAAEGHEIGNHTFSHVDPARLSESELREEIVRAADRIADVVGAAPALVRPPFGSQPSRFARVAADLGFGPTVLWSVNPLDWQQPPAHAIVERTLAGVAPGAIVDLHDGFGAPPGGVERQGTVRAVAELLPVLAERGYRCVTVSELLAVAPASK